MTYVVMSEFKDKNVDSGESHYNYVRFFSDKIEAENFAKKTAKKQVGIPEECIFALVETTTTPAPTDVALIAAK